MVGEGAAVTLGRAERQGDLLDPVIRFCEQAVAEDSVYALLHRERDHLFPDEFFSDLFTDRGRRSVPPSIVAVVMVWQKLGGLSDREAVERSPSTRAGATRRGWATGTRRPPGLPTRCWWTCALACATRAIPSGSPRVVVDVAGQRA
jgi:hypothetical protein